MIRQNSVGQMRSVFYTRVGQFQIDVGNTADAAGYAQRHRTTIEDRIQDANCNCLFINWQVLPIWTIYVMLELKKKVPSTLTFDLSLFLLSGRSY